MNKDILQGKWEQVKGIIQKNWGKLTNDDLDQIEGDYTRLKGILQEKYGYTREETQRMYDEVFGGEEFLKTEDEKGILEKIGDFLTGREPEEEKEVIVTEHLVEEDGYLEGKDLHGNIHDEHKIDHIDPVELRKEHERLEEADKL